MQNFTRISLNFSETGGGVLETVRGQGIFPREETDRQTETDRQRVRETETEAEAGTETEESFTQPFRDRRGRT